MELLGYAYPVAALALGVLLYRRHPGLYVSFTWWLWFLTPEVRRLVDYVQGYSTISPVMLAPYLVSVLTVFALAHHLPKLQLNRFFPFFLVFLGLSYAYAVGVYRAGLFSATYQLLEWTVPVMFAFYLVVQWRRYSVYRRAIRRTFILGILVMGIYGLIQFFVLPPWDRAWMEGTSITSIGQPQPFKVRVFSTLNSPQPFAEVMMVGLLLLLGGGGLLRLPAAVAGYVSFLLSLKRSAWGGWLVGVFFLITQRGQIRPGLVATVVVTVLAILPLLTVGPVADTINERVATISDIDKDNSFRARVEFYQETALPSLFNPVGEGLGSTGRSTKLDAEGGVGELSENAAFDSGILEIPFVLGWPGSLLYLGGMAWLVSYALRSRNSEDSFAVIGCSIVVGILVQLVFNDMVVGVVGMLVWTFVGLAIAADLNRGRVSKVDGSEPALEIWSGDQDVNQRDTVRKGVRRGIPVRSPGSFGQ